jgi:hypothetical protein
LNNIIQQGEVVEAGADVPDNWIADVREIAADLGMDADRLSALLRAAETIERLRSATSADDQQADRLLAARDREEDD